MPSDAPTASTNDPRPARPDPSARNRGGTEPERGRLSLAWYRLVQLASILWFGTLYSIRATGRSNLPASGGALLISNHLSYLDVFVLGTLLPRPLNYVARSTLFLPILGALIRSVGGFPIQREGMGAEGLKETLRRLRRGGIVVLFPEGTRSVDGEMGELKSGIAMLAQRAKVPVIPTGLAGTFESYPRGRLFPRPFPIRIHYGPPIAPEQIAGLDSETTTRLLSDRMRESQAEARRGLAGDLGLTLLRGADIDVGRSGRLG